MIKREREFKAGKHLYRRGWFGLIPMIGSFVGIGLMILAVFKYKDKKLFFIGLAGVLFTVAIYSSMYLYSTYSRAGREQWVDFAKTQLLTLTKDIEFYKLQNGAYPDSLQQLVSKEESFFVNDPLSLIGEGGKNTQFNYRRIGTKYTLFSSGLDKLPNTSDDIYPNILIPDSTRIGLIRK